MAGSGPQIVLRGMSMGLLSVCQYESRGLRLFRFGNLLPRMPATQHRVAGRLEES